jgi:hypothetical protein
MTTPRESHSAGPRQLPVGNGAAATRWQAGPQEVAACWLCGMTQSTAGMVADGGPGCADVRWYCNDAQQCTWRWTTKVGLAAAATEPSHLAPVAHEPSHLR